MAILITTLIGTSALLLVFFLSPVVYFKMAPETIERANKIGASFTYLISQFILYSCYIVVLILFDQSQINGNLRVFVPIINAVLLIGIIRVAGSWARKMSKYTEQVSREEKKALFLYTSIIFIVLLCMLLSLGYNIKYIEYIGVNVAIIMSFYIGLESIQENNRHRDFIIEIWNSFKPYFCNFSAFIAAVILLIIVAGTVIAEKNVPEGTLMGIKYGILISTIISAIILITLTKKNITSRIIERLLQLSIKRKTKREVQYIGYRKRQYNYMGGKTMCGETYISQYAESQDAIREYIHSGSTRDENWGGHIDSVTVIKDGETIFRDKLTVVSVIETNESFVEIIWPQKYEERFWIKYSNRYQWFRFEKGTLSIDCIEKDGEKIMILIG